MWYWRVWQGATHVRCIDVEESTAAEKFRGPKVINTVITTNTGFQLFQYTLYWKKCYPLPPVFSSSGYHSDGVACVAQKVSEGGLSCCWVAEVQGGPTTSLRMVGHMGGVETVGSWA